MDYNTSAPGITVEGGSRTKLSDYSLNKDKKFCSILQGQRSQIRYPKSGKSSGSEPRSDLSSLMLIIDDHIGFTNRFAGTLRRCKTSLIGR